MFRGKPNVNSDEFKGNAIEYLGGAEAAKKLLKDQIASPLYASGALDGAPPLYFAVGASESIMGDSVLLGQKAAQRGVASYVDVYDGMWHVFPMYSEGCGSGSPLWQGVSALRRSAFFMTQIVKTGGKPPCPAGGNRAALVWHYSEPGEGWGDNYEWYASDFCGKEITDETTWAMSALPRKPDTHDALVIGVCGVMLLAIPLARLRRQAVPMQAPLLG
jgi:hypothetical protein